MARIVLIQVVAFAAHLLASVSGKNMLVAYWGQNSVYHKTTPRLQEAGLSYFCENHPYDIINLSFMNVFFDSRNPGNAPGLNFANHCEQRVPGHTSLLKCPNIEQGIRACQARNKKVLISMGGAVGLYRMTSDQEGTLLAQNVWDYFFNSQKYPASQRPFGDAVLDGVDLDLEAADARGHTAFVREFRRLSGIYGDGRRYLITGAPQCPFPDASMGPIIPGSVLKEVPHEIDYLFVQFYNNYCHPTGGHFNADTWLAFSHQVSVEHNGKAPTILIGLPGGKKASGHDTYFKTISEISAVNEELKNDAFFGGFMLWDAGYDQHDVVGGKSYGQRIIDVMNDGTTPVTSPPTEQLTTEEAATEAPATTQPPTTTQTPATTQTPTTTQAPTTTESTTPQTTTQAQTTPSTGGTLSPQEDCSQKGTSHFLYSVPGDCGSFYQCANSNAYITTCPSGLMFNAAGGYCDWPINVSCN